MIVWLVVLAWFALGAGGFVFWWTRDWDLTVAEVPLMLLVGFAGPIAWVIGWILHGDTLVSESPTVLRKRR
jgi:hypothetical protein